jgi:hypothetical protein
MFSKQKFIGTVILRSQTLTENQAVNFMLKKL